MLDTGEITLPPDSAPQWVCPVEMVELEDLRFRVRQLTEQLRNSHAIMDRQSQQINELKAELISRCKDARKAAK